MKKLVIDCSKNAGERENLVDMTPEEISAQEKVWAENAKRDIPSSHPSEVEVVLAAIEAKVGITKEDKDAARAELVSSRGGKTP